jgi:hypothetical protein
MKHLRRGVSLTEMLVVMTACTVGFSLTGQLLCRVMRIYSQAQTHADVERTALRLATQFRRDVHAAKSAVTDSSAVEEDTLLLLHLPDGSQLVYAYRSGAIIRQLVRAGDVAAREEFAFTDPIDIAVVASDAPPRISLTITVKRPQRPTSKDSPQVREPRNPISLQIEAVLNRNGQTTAALLDGEASE